MEMIIVALHTTGVFPFQVIICDPLGQADKDFEAPESIQDDPGDREPPAGSAVGAPHHP